MKPTDINLFSDSDEDESTKDYYDTFTRKIKLEESSEEDKQ